MVDIPNFKTTNTNYSNTVNSDFEERFQRMTKEYEMQIEIEVKERQEKRVAEISKQLERAEKLMKAEHEAEKTVLELSKTVCDLTTSLLKRKK